MNNITKYINKWEDDLGHAPVPNRTEKIIEFIPPSTPDDKVNQLRFVADSLPLLVQADPNDILSFSVPILGKKDHHANLYTWECTLDYYLYRYYQLVYQRDSEKWTTIELPYEVNEKFINNNRREKSSKKHLIVNLQDFIPQERASSYRMPQLLGGAYLNTLSRTLWTYSNAHKLQSSLFYDGLKFRINGSPEFIPQFNVEDYMSHELATGIGLSIEIASVLLEFEDPQLKDDAFDLFCTEMLPNLISRPFFFTRNTIARNFFQQILLESENRSYQWKSEYSGLPLSASNWEDVIIRATIHKDELRKPSISIDTDDCNLDKEIYDMRNLISLVSIPVNPFEYVANPTHGLAMFCHPFHKNVPFYLNELSKNDLNNTAKVMVPQSEKHRVFQDVHKRIKSAIQF